MFETTREYTLTKRNLACSIITISEIATPMTLLLEVDSQCNCEKQEYQDIIPTNGDRDTSMISANVLLKETF